MVGRATGAGLVVVAVSVNGVRVDLLDTLAAIRQVATDMVATLDALGTAQ